MKEKELFDKADLAAGALAGKGAQGFDVYVRSSASTGVEVKDQALDAFEEADTWGVGVRVMLDGGRMGFAWSSGSDEAVKDAALLAIENAKSSEPDAHNNFPVPPEGYPAWDEYDEGHSEIGEQEKIARAVELEKAALEFDPRVGKVRKSSASFSSAGWALVSSTGVRAASRGTYFSCGIMVVAEESGDSQMGYDFDFKRSYKDMGYAAVGRKASERAVSLLGARPATSGVFPVVLENIITSEFLGVLAQSFSAESVLKGKSMLANKVGQQALSNLINIVDDGLAPGGAGSRPFDDEGAPSRRTPLIIEGVLQGFLHNSYTAKRHGSASTGNALRGGFSAQPSVGPSNLWIEKGGLTRDELISGVSSGLLVQEVLGMHTANPISGDFSVGVTGQWIEGGKVAYPVREAAIAGNILGIFSEVEAVADDLRAVGRLGAPTILLRPISVSGS